MCEWITIWNQSHTNIKTVTPKYRNRTMWLTVPVTAAGERVRLRFSNREGGEPLHILQAAVSLDSGERLALSFNGSRELILAPGEERASDALALPAARGQLLSIFAAFHGDVTSGNCIAAHVQCSQNGNFVFAPQIRICRQGFQDSYWGNLPGIPAISAVEVLTPEKPGVIVCFGDSITQQSNWTLPLQRRLGEAGCPAVVLNGGIGGNRLLLGPPGPDLQVFGRAAMERFRRDVLEVQGVTAVILALGTNDIGWIRTPEEIQTAGADAVFAGLARLAHMAHEKNLQVFAATLTPRNGSLDYTPAQEGERVRLNEKIRAADCFDGVLEFDEAAADPGNPDMLAPCCDSGDHLHPSALGGEKMAARACDVLVRTLGK